MSDDVNALVAEARRVVVEHPGREMLTGTMHLIEALADAVESLAAELDDPRGEVE